MDNIFVVAAFTAGKVASFVVRTTNICPTKITTLEEIIYLCIKIISSKTSHHLPLVLQAMHLYEKKGLCMRSCSLCQDGGAANQIVDL